MAQRISKAAQMMRDAQAIEFKEIKSFYSERLGYTVYWKPDSYKTRSKYFADAIGEERTDGLLKCFFLRAMDENGKNLFLTQDDWAIIKESTSLWPAIFEVAAQMIGGKDDDFSSFKSEAETEKEQAVKD